MAVFQFADITHHFEWPSNQTVLEPYEWYSFCISFDAHQNNVTLAINGKTILNEAARYNSTDQIFSKNIELGNHLSKPFMGKISDFNVWNRPLSPTEVLDFSNCTPIQTNSSSAFLWSAGKLSVDESKKIIIPLSDVCSEGLPPKLKLFHQPVSFYQAISIAKHLNGEMFLPKNDADLERALMLDKSRLLSNCQSSMWFPIKRSECDFNFWVNAIKVTEEVNYLPWMSGQPNGYPIQNCVGYEKKGYNDNLCEEQRCFVAKFKKSPVFHLRGQCALNETIDIKYVFKFDALAMDIFMFQGFSGKSNIIGNFSRNVWELVISHNYTIKKSTVIASLFNIRNFPFGTNNWTFNHNWESGNRQYILMKISKVNVI